MNGLEHLAIMSQPAVAHITFGWFNLAWPNIAFWIAVVVVFFLFAWLRIPPLPRMSGNAVVIDFGARWRAGCESFYISANSPPASVP